MHQMRLTLSKHHGMQTRNCLKRLFVEQCRLQSLKTKLMKIYSRVQIKYRKIKRLANFRDCIKWGCLEAHIMEPKFETIWSGVFWTMWLTVTQTKTNKKYVLYSSWKNIQGNEKTWQFQEMHQLRLTLSKHHGIQTRNCLKRLFVERCGLQ